MTEAVVDTSAVLAIIHREPGAQMVQAVVRDAAMTAINHAEVLQHLVDHRLGISTARQMAQDIGYRVVDCDLSSAVTVAMIHERTRRRGVSLGDLFCLALARDRGLPVLTADRLWSELDLGVEVRLIR